MIGKERNRDSKGKFVKNKEKYTNTNCLLCGNPFYARPCKSKENKGKYCSKKCYWLSKIGKPTWNKGILTLAEVKENEKFFNQKWRHTHKKMISTYRKEWVKRHPEKKLEMYLYKKQWRKDYPEKEQGYKEKRRALLLNASINDFTFEQWKEMLTEYNYCCSYCGKKGGLLTQDHVIPLSKSGNHTKNNIVPACSKCNCKKNNIVLSINPKDNHRLFKIYLTEGATNESHLST